MGYKLYVVILNDGSWRFAPYTENPVNIVSTFYMKGSDTEALELTKENKKIDALGVRSWEFVTDVADADTMKVQEALNDAFKIDMHRPQDMPNCQDEKGASEGNLGNVDRCGTWAQTFVILALKRMEKAKIVKSGTADEFKSKV